MYFFERVHPRLSTTLDCLRWIAAGMVVVSHARNMVFAGWSTLADDQHTAVKAAFYLFTAFGHQAVIVFFVLSGFLVGGSVVNDLRRQRFSFARYLVNRVSRLYVVLVPALLLGWCCDLIGSNWFNAQGVYTHAWPQLLWSMDYPVVERLSAGIAVANLFNLQTIFAPTFGSNGPLWSLANEFWYYILFPLCLAPFMRWHSWGVRGALVLIAAAVVVLIHPDILIYGAVWALGVGIRFLPRPLVPWTWASALLALVMVVISARLPHWRDGIELLADGLLALAIGNLLLTLMHHARPDVGLAGGRLHAVLADFSYSLYLLHFPLLVLLCAASQSWFGIGLSMTPSGWLPFAFMALVVVLMYAYAWLTSLVTERHTAAVREVLMRWLRLQPAVKATPQAKPVMLPGSS